MYGVREAGSITYKLKDGVVGETLVSPNKNIFLYYIIMVLSSSKKVAAISSIVNQPQGGGPNKAGFAYIVGRNNWFRSALKQHQTRDTLMRLNGVPGLQDTLNPNVCQSRPVSSWTGANSYFRACLRTNRR